MTLLATSITPAHAAFDFDLVGAVQNFFTDDPNQIPTAVLESANQVVQVRSAGGPVVFEINTKDPVASQEAIEAFRKAGAITAADQVEFCLKSQLHNCPIFEKEISGSGFFAFNEYILFTSYHLLQPTIHRAFENLPTDTNVKDLLTPISRQPIFVKIQARGGKTLMGTNWDPRSVRVDSINPSILYMAADSPEALQGNLEGELSDVLTLAVHTPVNSYLKVARSLPAPGTKVYATGYHYSTKKPGRGGALDIRPLTLLNTADFHHLMGTIKIQDTRAEIALRNQFLILLDGPCKRGKSGGPILDSHGDVLGVIVGTYESVNVGRDFCYGINLTAANSGHSLRNHWDQVNRKMLKNLEQEETEPTPAPKLKKKARNSAPAQ